MYLTYNEYTAYGGTLEETAYNEYAFEADSLINYATFNRLKNDTTFPTEVKRLVYALVDLINKREQSLTLGASSESTPGIASQSNDGVSVSYNGMPASTLYGQTKSEINRKISLYLSGVKNTAGQLVLYRGLYEGE